MFTIDSKERLNIATGVNKLGWNTVSISVSKGVHGFAWVSEFVTLLLGWRIVMFFLSFFFLVASYFCFFFNCSLLPFIVICLFTPCLFFPFFFFMTYEDLPRRLGSK